MNERRAVVEVDVPAVGRGAALAVLVGAAAAVLARLVDAVSDDSPLALPLLLVTLAGLVGGGWVAARACLRHPLTNGALAALVAIGVLLTVNVARQLVGGDDVRWAPRPHRTSPPFDELDGVLAAGARLDHELFPVVWPR